jgi:predicted adenine nucleotide alpha hydrolase (AANH) superfamily ATPase
MKILVHQCCAPCSVYPISELKGAGYDITTYFFNPNIHPLKEFYLRLEQAVLFNREEGLEMIIDPSYGLTEFTRAVSHRESSRCAYCYSSRMEKTAQMAVEKGFDCFSTTLLYSKFQKHELLIDMGEAAAKKYGVAFHYEDWREGWQCGIDESVAREMYRQNYCGCIYSEEDRFSEQLKRKIAKLIKTAD